MVKKMSVHKIEYGDSPAGAGEQQAEVWLKGYWFIHSVSLQNEDSAAGEEGIIRVQFNNRGGFEAARPWHPLNIGLTREDAPLLSEVGLVMGWPLFCGQVDHVGAVSHRLTVLGYKVRDR